MSTRDPTDLSHRSDLALSDFVLAMTKAILRPGGFSREQAEASRALESLHRAFVDLMAHRSSELVFELSAPPDSPQGHDVLIDDGLNHQYLSQILTQGIAETFVGKLVEFFVSHGLVVFVLKKDLNRRDLETFLERRGHHEKSSPGEVIDRTAEDLAASGVNGVLAVPDRDRIEPLSGRVTWRAELLLARISREGRCIPAAAKAWNEDPIDLVRRTFDNLFKKKHLIDTIQAAAVHLPTALPDPEMLAQADHALLASVSGSTLPRLANRLVEQVPTASSSETSRIHDLLQRMVGLLLQSSTPECASALASIQTAGIILDSELNDDERRLMRAAALAKACSTSIATLQQMMDHSSSATPLADAVEDLELAAMGLIQQRDWRLGTALLRVLRDYAEGQETSPAGGDELALAAIHRLGNSAIGRKIHRTLISPRESNGRAQEVLALLEPTERANILKDVLRDTPEITLRQWALDELAEVSPKVPGFLADAISAPGVQQGLLRNLFTIIRRTKDDTAFEAVGRHLGNSKSQLRTEALSTLAELSVQRALPSIQRGLEDASPDVRTAAVQALAKADNVEGSIVRLLLTMTQDDSEQDSLRAQALLSLGHLGALAGNAEWRSGILERLREVVEDKHGGAFRRFKRLTSSRKPPAPPVLAAACRGLGQIGAEEDIKLLRSCLSDESSEVKDAAQLALEDLRVSSNPGPR